MLNITLIQTNVNNSYIETQLHKKSIAQKIASRPTPNISYSNQTRHKHPRTHTHSPHALKASRTS